MSQDRRAPGDPGSHGADDALVRLEDVLLALPFDRALPDLDDLLERAEVPPDLLRRDDRARKLIHEAIVARPLSTLDAVQQVRTEVELLTLEVEVLTDQFAAATDHRTRADLARRLAEVRARVEDIRGQL
ncbi:MAG TPA: hypothetical protein VK906_02205 [Egicoccus sp.]|nr:hypothetical protein [Egicoccus sp.]HSK21956.1 hypothetical protein [Egicoccus sp.]